jgi:methionine salvage enolase-phosphatase E1
MKDFVDIHTVLSTPDDMEDIHEYPEAASDKLNEVLHLVYDLADDDINPSELENILGFVWEHWHQDRHLADIEVDDLVDWVDHLLDTWDNEQYTLDTN